MPNRKQVFPHVNWDHRGHRRGHHRDRAGHRRGGNSPAASGQQQFGPEYDRLAREHDSKQGRGRARPAARRRVRKLDLRPLSPEAQKQYTARWMSLQERFVDDPEDAVAQSQTLVAEVMHERGYPTEHRDQVAADLSVSTPRPSATSARRRRSARRPPQAPPRPRICGRP
jgi:hypothetical protein